MANTLNWGILGTGRIAREFAEALPQSRTGQLAAVASRAPITTPAAEFARARLHHDYDALLADPTVDAVYIAIPHPMHAEWVIRAAEAGKHVLCEKPLALNAAEASAAIDAARRADIFLMEAFMYRLTPQTRRLIEILQAGAIGEVRLIQASFGYLKPFQADIRHYANALGGGAILDVGCYPLSMARLVAGIQAGQPVLDPIKVEGVGVLAPTGVDMAAVASLAFANGVLAELSTSIGARLDNAVRIHGTAGSLELPSPWMGAGRHGGRSSIILRDAGGVLTEIAVTQDQPLYAIEADHVADNIDRRQGQWPAPDWADSQGNMQALDRWRRAIGLVYDLEKPGGRTRPLSGRRISGPLPGKAMPAARIAGVDKPAARLAMGTVGITTLPEAAVLYDAYVEAGGNLFDTARHYQAGAAEGLFGAWMRDRGLRDQLVIIGKGAHSPNCVPAAVEPQLLASLEQLGTDHIDVYFLHRDNPDVPVGEFVDILDALARAGRIGCFGGSNWTIARLQEANDWAAAHGKQGFQALSNQFSLAEMLEPVWAGCLSAGDEASVGWLTRTATPLFAWSALAHGFLTDHASDDAAMARSWHSPKNLARRERAREMAAQRGTTLAAVALAYVLAQPFPVFPLIGPLSLRELRSSLSVLLTTPLDPDHVRWLRDDGGEAPAAPQRR